MANYQPSDFLYHREYGVGRVEAVREGQVPEVEIDFEGHGQVTLTEQLVRRSTSRLSPEGFRAFAYSEPEQAEQLLEEDPVEVICRVLEDFVRRRAKTEDLKDYLSSYVQDWEKWWKSTQPLLKESPRIDSTKSQTREYGVMQEELSPARAAYRSFSHLRKFEGFPMVYDQARRALRAMGSDSDIEDEEREDLLDYFRQVVISERYPIAERMDAFFRLVESKWLDPEQTQDQIEKLVKTEFHIYELEPFAQQRVIRLLIHRPVDETSLILISSGMGAAASVIQMLHEWAVRKSDPSVIARLIVAGLSENLPPDLVDYASLKTRLEVCVELAKCLPLDSPHWSEIFNAFFHATRAIGAVPDLNSIKILLPPLITLAWELHMRAPKVVSDENAILADLVDPRLKIEYIVALLDAAGISDLPKEFSHQIEERLLATTDERGDNFLSPLLSWRWKNPSEQAAALAGIVKKYPGQALIERAGWLMHEIAKQAREDELQRMIPFLNSFSSLPGTWSWRDAMEALREKAHFEMLHRQLDLAQESYYQDSALLGAVKQYLALHLEAYQQEIQNKEEKVSELQTQIRDAEIKLNEKDTVLRELRNSAGGDSRGARFEERSRILRDLVNTMAEFDRFAAELPGQSKEITGMLQRLENLAAANRVIPLESIGKQVSFDTQKHRLIEGGNVSPGAKVIIVERGYLIRDNADRLRLLKPALVKKT